MGLVGLPQPRRVGRYEVLVPIASGGMAVVYLAHQRGVGGFGREVAIKLVHLHLRDNPEWSVSLLAEAKLAARIRHPNVVQTLDVGEDSGGDYLVMEYVEGDTFASMIRYATKTPDKTLPLGIAARILVDALSGLHATHELTDDDGRPLLVVHRDFSPQNVLVGLDGIARLSDFGVAKAADRAGFTATGTIKGKFAFMSPEQVRAQPLDRRSDVWSAGVVMWEALAGQRMFERGLDEASMLLRIASEEAPSLHAANPSVPGPLCAVVTHALARDLSKRTPSALALRDELVAALQELGVSLASHDEVGAYVRRVAGATIDQRRVAARAARSAGADEGEAASATARGLEVVVDIADVTKGAKTLSSLVSDTRRPRRTRTWGVLVSVASAIAIAGAALWLRREPVALVPSVSSAAAFHPLPIAELTSVHAPESAAPIASQPPPVPTAPATIAKPPATRPRTMTAPTPSPSSSASAAPKRSPPPILDVNL